MRNSHHHPRNFMKCNIFFLIFILSSLEEHANIKPLLDQMEAFKSEGKKVTLILFCSPYFFCPTSEANNVILAYEAAPEAQVAAVEVLNRLLQPEGVLPRDIAE